MKRTKAHERALAKIRDLKRRLARVQSDYDKLRWTHDPVFGYDPNMNFGACTGGMLKQAYDDRPGAAADIKAVSEAAKTAFANLDLAPSGALR